MSLDTRRTRLYFAVVRCYSCGFAFRENTVRKSWGELRLRRCLSASRIQSAITVKRRFVRDFFFPVVFDDVLKQTNTRTCVFWDALSFSPVFVIFWRLCRDPHYSPDGLRNVLQWLANGESFTIVDNRAVRYRHSWIFTRQLPCDSTPFWESDMALIYKIFCIWPKRCLSTNFAGVTANFFIF